MFGIIRPCRHRLSPALRESWLAHLCGLCLALRDDHGQLARTVTNYDGIVVSALVEAQVSGRDGRRTAGPCPLRGMRTATIAYGRAPQLAAAVSLVLASAKVSDHVEDGDGAFGRRPVAGVARKVATRWARQGAVTGERIGFDTAVLLDAVHRQGEVESAVHVGSSVLLATEPTETATAEAFAHTAVLAGRPGNAPALREAGRLFGRVAHLLDAVADLAEDDLRGAWNPLRATGTSVAEAERLCTDAVTGIRLALRDAEFADGALVHRLLVHELDHAVQHAFGRAHGPHGPSGSRPQGPPPPGWQPPQPPPNRQQPGPPPPGWQPPQPPPQGPGGPGGPQEPMPRWGKRRTGLAGCGMSLLLCCSCQYCCADPYHDPWTGEPKEGLCHRGDCCDCSDCGCCGCDCCDCDCCGCDCGC